MIYESHTRVDHKTLSESKIPECVKSWQHFDGPWTSQGRQNLNVNPRNLCRVPHGRWWTYLNLEILTAQFLRYEVKCKVRTHTFFIVNMIDLFLIGRINLKVLVILFKPVWFYRYKFNLFFSQGIFLASQSQVLWTILAAARICHGQTSTKWGFLVTKPICYWVGVGVEWCLQQYV